MKVDLEAIHDLSYADAQVVLKYLETHAVSSHAYDENSPFYHIVPVDLVTHSEPFTTDTKYVALSYFFYATDPDHPMLSTNWLTAHATYEDAVETVLAQICETVLDQIRD